MRGALGPAAAAVVAQGTSGLLSRLASLSFFLLSWTWCGCLLVNAAEPILPWTLVDGNACERLEDGCFQSLGFPDDYPNNGGCIILATTPGYIVDATNYTWNLSNGDGFYINGVSRAGPIKEDMTYGVMIWSSDSEVTDSGWKICPRTTCSTYWCPDNYVLRPDPELIQCQGLTCTDEADLDTCCVPLCSVPTKGHIVGGSCSVYQRYAEGDECLKKCVGGFQWQTWRLPEESHAKCPGPGEYIETPPCTDENVMTEYPPWYIPYYGGSVGISGDGVESLNVEPTTMPTNGCEQYNRGCIQTTHFPLYYADSSYCIANLPGKYSITIESLDLEEDWDILQLGGKEFPDTNFTGQGSSLGPFIIESLTVTFVTDSLIARTGWRICARPLCSTYTCPDNMLFDCEQVEVGCQGPVCKEVDAEHCCRNATAEELSSNGGSITSSNANNTCGLNGEPVTSTTTTFFGSSIGISNGPAVGYVELEIPVTFLNDTDAVVDAWREVIGNILYRDDMWLIGDVVPDTQPDQEVFPWRIGYQVHQADQTAFLLKQTGRARLETLLNDALNSTGISVVVVNNTVVSNWSWVDGWPAMCEDTLFHLLPKDREPGGRPVDYLPYICEVWEEEQECTRYGEGEDNMIGEVTMAMAIEHCCRCGGGRCQPGSFVLRGHATPDFCAPCKQGRYSRAYDTVGECLPCEVGRYQDYETATDCWKAWPGAHVPNESSTMATPCAPGTYTSEAGQSACKECEAGRYAPDAGSDSCRRCSRGQYTPFNGSVECFQCEPGFYAEEEGMADCLPCPAGTSSENGAPGCGPCPPGRAAPTEGSNCELCNEGQFNAIEGALECQPCAPGDWAQTIGLTQCVDCPAGRESLVWGAADCDLCSAGTAKAEGEPNCSSCVAGQYSPRDGQSACDDCPQGTEGPIDGLSKCKPCDAGYFSASLGAELCTPCQAGKFERFTGSIGCADCEPGSFTGSSGFTSCDDCALGHYTDQLQASECQQCNPGQHGPELGLTACVDCATGYLTEVLGESACKTCNVGQYNPLAGRSYCLQCDPGRYSSSLGGTECLRCDSGRFAQEAATVECSWCFNSLNGRAEYWTTFEWDEAASVWEETTGASNLSACGCRAGTQPDGQVNIDYVSGGAPMDPLLERGNGCVGCGEGLICQGMGVLRIAQGYAWDGKLSVFDCSNGVVDACPGGLPGVCAEGRDTSVVACAQCLPGKVAAGDGRCVECGGADYGVPAVGLVCVLILACVCYIFYDRPRRKRPSLTILLILISLGQLVTIVQQLGVVSSIRVDWVNPVDDLYEFVMALSFLDVEILRPGCLVTMDAVRSYVGRVLLVYLALLLIVVAHLSSQLVQHRHDWRHRFPVLFNAIGIIIMAFFVTIISTMLGPMQCKDHPNGKKTVSWYASVLCWDSNEHTTMMVIGIAACSLPLAFLALAVWAAKVFPRKLVKGSRRFFICWSFLFFRYHAEAHWYGPLLLVRNALVAAVPPLPESVMQILVLQVVMLISLQIILRVMPWRAFLANYLEILMHVAMLFVVTCAAFFVDEDASKALSVISFISIVLMPCGIIFLIILALMRLCRASRKPYQFFLCHHKAGAGCFARVLKMRLQTTSGVTGKVFIDTDDLQNLDLLFDAVANDTEMLVAIHSAQLLLRPWCIGEIVTAHRSSINMQVVRTFGVEPVSEEFIERFKIYVPDTSCLTDQGINLEMVTKALQYFQGIHCLHLEQELHDVILSGLAEALVGRPLAAESLCLDGKRRSSLPNDMPLLILADTEELEGASTAFILSDLLLPVVVHRWQVPVHVLGAGQEVPPTTKAVLVCTSSIWGSHAVAAVLILAKNQELVLMPVMSTNNFMFPSSVALEANPAFSTLDSDEADVALCVLQAIFTEIAVDFKPAALSANEALLTERAKNIANRLFSGMQTLHERVMRGTSSRIDKASRLVSADSKEDREKANGNQEQDDSLSLQDIEYFC